LREVADSKGELQIVEPSVSIRAEPSVALVETNVAKHQTRTEAQAYLSYLFSDEAQELLARNGYRPINEEIARRHRDQFPDIDLFPITLVARDWDEAQVKFFGETGIFESIHTQKVK
jgi:sulfate transport system substrate-binding protein